MSPSEIQISQLVDFCDDAFYRCSRIGFPCETRGPIESFQRRLQQWALRLDVGVEEGVCLDTQLNSRPEGISFRPVIREQIEIVRDDLGSSMYSPINDSIEEPAEEAPGAGQSRLQPRTALHTSHSQSILPF